MTRAFTPAAALALLFCVATVQAATPSPPLIIEHVTVLPMTAGGAPVPNAFVLIENGRITRIVSERNALQARGAKRINATGKFLMPGFSDMHMHLENDRMMRLYSGSGALPDGSIVLEDVLTPYLANGITQIFDLSAMSEEIGQRVEVESGRVLGPHIASAAMIDGAPPLWPPGMTRVAANPEDGRQAVRDAKAEGYDAIKTYSKLSLETFSAIVDEARKQNMRVLGHIPQRNQGITEKFFQPGYGLVAHAEEFAQQTWPPAPAAIPAYVKMAKRNGTWLTATLTLDERIVEQMRNPASLAQRAELRHLHPLEYGVVLNDNRYLKEPSAQRVADIQSIVDFNAQLVRAFVTAGIPVLTGTDAPVPGVAPGFSLHDEFLCLTKAGMSNLQVLEATTRLPAEWLGTLGDRGTVEVGKRADLVLLAANPLADIANTRRIDAVIIGGRYLPHAELAKRLATLAARNR